MIKNIIANFVGKFWSILSNFLFIPLYINYLGFESYTVISFTLVVAGIMAILDTGLSATLSREFARADTSLSDKIQIFRTLESIYFLMICLSLIIMFFGSDLIAEKWLNLNNLELLRISFFLKIITLETVFQLLLRFYLGGLLGLERQIKANMLQIGWGVLRNGCVVIIIMFLPTLDVFFIWQAVATIIFAFLLRIFLTKALVGKYFLGIKPKIEVRFLKNVWKFAGGMMLISIIASLNTQLDKLAISKFLSLESLGYYTLAISLSQGIVVLVNPIATAILPRFTLMYSKNQQHEAVLLFSKISLIVSILVFSIMINMSFYAKELIWIWTGKFELASKVYKLIPTLSFAYAMLSLQILSYNIAIANGYTKLNNIIGLISVFITIPGYIVATKQYGSIGAALAFAIIQTTITIVYLYFINKRYLNYRIVKDVYIKQIILPFIATFIIGFMFNFLLDFTVSSRVIALFKITAFSVFTFLLVIYIFMPMSMKKIKGYIGTIPQKLHNLK